MIQMEIHWKIVLHIFTYFQVNDVTTAADFTGTESANIAANTAAGDTAQGAVLTRLAAVSSATCTL